MIVDLREIRDFAAAPGAVIVVGSGAAGLALAERLAAAGTPVVLLESGGDLTRGWQRRPDSAELNQGVTLGMAYSGLTEGRSRNLGGTGQLWHGQCMRLHPIDLTERAWIPGSGWPIGPDELDPHYESAENWFEVSGKGYGPERWQEHPKLAPLDWNPDHLLHDFTEYTPKPMLGQHHRSLLARDRLITVILNATVARVLLSGDRISGVQVLGAAGRSSDIAADRVVLAAGAIENARLLQLSDPDGVGLGSGRWHTGRYLQDHPIIRTAEVISADHRILQDRYVALHRRRQRLFPKVRLAPTVQQEHGLLDATAVFMHDHDEAALAAARRLLISARTRRAPEEPLRDLMTALRAPAPVARDAYRRYLTGRSTGAKPSAVWLQLWLEQLPDPDSRVSLSDTTDSLGLRRPQVTWRISDLELETSRQMTRWIAADLKRLGLAEVRELAPMHDDDAWRASVTDAFHPSGTTRMSRRPEDGVVDPDLAVHGLAGLFVVGGSVFPIAGYANPTLTIVALAMRLADHLSAAR